MGSYVVTGALAIVPVGKTEEYLFRGAAVPKGAPDSAIEHLLSVNLIAEVAEPAAEPTPPAEVPESPAAAAAAPKQAAAASKPAKPTAGAV